MIRLIIRFNEGTLLSPLCVLFALVKVYLKVFALNSSKMTFA